MANRVVMVSIAPGNPMFQSPLGDARANIFGDWLRINAFTWLIWTDRTTAQVSDHFRAAFGPNDIIVVTYLEPKQAAGSAPQWIWNWINSKANINQGLGAALSALGMPKPKS